VLNICSGFVGGSVQVGYNLDRPEQSAQQADLHMAQVQGKRNLEAVWGRFGQESRSFGQQGNPCTICKSCKAA
jgi:hypothetical protein